MTSDSRVRSPPPLNDPRHLTACTKYHRIGYQNRRLCVLKKHLSNSCVYTSVVCQYIVSCVWYSVRASKMCHRQCKTWCPRECIGMT